MNIQVSARAFKSVAEQRAHAAEVHKRLMTATKPRDLEKAKARIAELEVDVVRLEDENGVLSSRAASLELDLADLRAAFMSQAKYLADVEDRITGDTSFEFHAKKTVTRIVTEVLKDFPGVTWEDILSPRRSRGLIQPRHACMRAVCAQRPDLSYPAIGRIFHRDHTTVLHAVNGKEG